MDFPVSLTVGVEEEYQIIDPESRELAAYIQHMLEADDVLGEILKPEFLQSQIEMGTQVCHNVTEIRDEIKRIRGAVAQLAENTGVRIAAAGTHPFSHWANQAITDRQRYVDFAEDMQQVVRSLLIFGMHVHVGFGDSRFQRELMVTVMNEVRYFMPHILALSTSSPFWMGENTGLKSYRNIVFKQLPRTGIPMRFRSWNEYYNHVQLLSEIGSLGKEAQTTGHIGDSTRIWWDIRPHPKYHTLEFRICDVVPRIEEAVTIAALFQGLCAMLIRLRQQNMSWRTYASPLIEENKWRAVRYGVQDKLVDFGKGVEVPFPALIDEIIELLDPVLDDLGSRKEVEYAATIAREGSSADRQIRVFEQAKNKGATQQDALNAVVDSLIDETCEAL